jgi:hypothetical protein
MVIGRSCQRGTTDKGFFWGWGWGVQKG